MQRFTRPAARATAGLAALTMAAHVAGCGRPDNTVSAAPPQNAPYGSVPAPNQQERAGMSTRTKLAVLAGAAALYYMYQKNKNKQGAGPQGQYYRSKNGRVYYRDARGNAIWVTPPAGGIQVPADEAEMYRQGARDAGFDRAYSGGY